VALEYEAVGSQAGIARVRARAVDFAASEMPLPKADLDRDSLLQFPIVFGAVVVAANLDGLAGRELRLSGPVLADIFRGRIKDWSDVGIAQLNPGLGLPKAPIAVLHRADGSGTTFTFTQFLVQASAAWKSEVGSDLLVNWPAGEGYKGNAGVARALQRTPNAIAYLGQGQLPPRMAVVSVQGAGGSFVAPNAAGVQVAVSSAQWDPSNGFNTSLTQATVEGSYPIVAAVFALLNQRSTGYRRRLTRSFFTWSLTQGRDTAVRLGYTPLPAALSQQVLAVLQ
jgi:phosphate transport system substrate-binding protein